MKWANKKQNNFNTYNVTFKKKKKKKKTPGDIIILHKKQLLFNDIVLLRVVIRMLLKNYLINSLAKTMERLMLLFLLFSDYM